MTVRIQNNSRVLREELVELKAPSAPNKFRIVRNSLISNGDFSEGYSGWTLNTSAAHFELPATGGIKIKAIGVTDGQLRVEVPTVIGAHYRIRFTLVSAGGASASGARLRVGSTAGSNDVDEKRYGQTPDNTDEVLYFMARSNISHITFRTYSNDQEAIIDNISMVEVKKNLLRDGSFNDNNGSGQWTVSGDYSQFENNERRAWIGDSGTNTGLLSQANVFEEGKTYTVAGDVIASRGQIQLIFKTNNSNATTGGHYYSTVPVPKGTFSFTFVAGSETSATFLAGGDDVWVRLDNLYAVEGQPDIFSLPRGAEPKKVFLDGLLQKEGAGEDYVLGLEDGVPTIDVAVPPSPTTEIVITGVKK